MVYKVTADFDNGLWNIIQGLNQYNLTYIDGFLYISDVKSIDNKLKNDIITNMPDENYFIKEINRNNLDNENFQAKDWCEKQIVWSELIQYEKNNQQQLKNTMNYLNYIEKLISQQQNEGSEINGGAKEKKRKA